MHLASPSLATAAACCLLAVAIASPASGQSTGLSADAWAGAGLDGRLEALGREVSGVPVMAGAEVSYHLPLPADFSAGLGLGGMYVRRDGRLEDERFDASALRFTVTPELGYAASRQLSLRAGLEIRNAADLSDFDVRREDNVRPYLRLGGDYRLRDGLALTATVSRLLGDAGDVDNLVDPGRSIRLGLRHCLSRSCDEG